MSKSGPSNVPAPLAIKIFSRVNRVSIHQTHHNSCKWSTRKPIAKLFLDIVLHAILVHKAKYKNSNADSTFNS